MAESENGSKSMNQMFHEINKCHSSIETTNEASSSEIYQNLVTQGIKLCTDLAQMVNQLSLFSDNEELEELSSESLKYILLPAFHGYFVARCLSDDRKTTLKSSKDHFLNFLKLCTNYSIPEAVEDSKSLDPGQQRAMKVNRLKMQKSLDSRISELLKYVEADHVDEEVKREFYVSQLKRWILTAKEEIDSIERELPILEMMANGGPPRQTKKTQEKTFQSFLLTRSKAQAKVFGAGYPSLPTYSVEEFFDMQVENGRLPLPGSINQPNQAHGQDGDDDKVKEEEAEERDDPEYLQKKRNFDEFKDENRRGSGNRYNRG